MQEQLMSIFGFWKKEKQKRFLFPISLDTILSYVLKNVKLLYFDVLDNLQLGKLEFW